MKKFKSIKTKIVDIIKENSFYHFFLKLYYRLENWKVDTILGTKTFFQRGKRGWANSDTWDFSHYLSKTIEEGVRHLKKHTHGHPPNLTEGQWIDILNKIINTFNTARKLDESELYYIENKKAKEKWQKSLNRINRKYKCHMRCMTDNEIKEYEEGWNLFRTHFFSLWD